MLGASLGRWRFTTRGWSFESCNVGAAMLADGAVGKGSTEPSPGTPAAWTCTTVTTLMHRPAANPTRPTLLI